MIKSKFFFNLLIIIALFVSIFNFGARAKTEALSGSSFKAGRIIDNSTFFDGDALSATRIQSFLDSKVPDCDDGYTCLKDYSRSGTPERAAQSELCNKLGEKTTSQSAAKIIYSVGKACGVSQKVLIVLLQKEQSLITDTSPSTTQYRSATGYGCPDTAPCNSEYYGFFNQVYKAAWQFKKYARDKDTYSYKAGLTNQIQYHPRTSCGKKSVFIENQATAGLYNYTPYTPNKAALSHLYGLGDSCSSYGNRNFWRLFNDWFGNPIGQSAFRLIECSGQKYMIESYIAKKRQLSDYAIREWGLTDFFVSGDSDKGCGYPAYTLPLNNIAGSRNTGKKYLLNRQTFINIQSSSIARAWGFESEYNSETPQFEGRTLSELQINSKLARLARSANSGKVYLLDGGKIYPISGTGSPDTNTTYLKLITGYDAVPVITISGEYLSQIKNTPDTNDGLGGTIRASFHVGSDWYLFDHGTVRRINPVRFNDRWQYVGSLFDGPDLSADVPAIIGTSKQFGKGFQRDGRYYVVRTSSNPGDIESTTSKSMAKWWEVYDSPSITNLLKNVILSQ